MKRRESLGLAGSMALASLYPTVGEPSSITVTRIENDLVNANGKKIEHITDTHFGTQFGTSLFNVDLILEIIRDERPDYIFHTGDAITYLYGLEEALSFFKELSEIAPVYVVAGNHDRWSGLGSNRLKEELESLEEVKVLNNEYVGLERSYLIGVDDPYTCRDNLGKAMPKGDKGKILLAHFPQIIGKAKGRVGLILARHAHGGQVRLPLIGPIYLPLPREYLECDRGLFNIGGTAMYVSRGLGASFPLRFMRPPEIVIIG